MDVNFPLLLNVVARPSEFLLKLVILIGLRVVGVRAFGVVIL